MALSAFLCLFGLRIFSSEPQTKTFFKTPPETGIVKKILEIKRVGKQKNVLVQWVGTPEPSWHGYKEMKEDQPAALKEFERN